MIQIILCILFGILLAFILKYLYERYYVIEEKYYTIPTGPALHYWSGEYQPWWNSTRHTRNMSYDIRGDYYPLYYPTGPWFQTSFI